MPITVREHPLSSALGSLLFLTGLFLLNFTSRVIFSPLLPVIENEMGIDHAESGSLFLFLSAGYFLSILASGFVSARINHKRCIVVSTLAVGIALLVISRCPSLIAMQAGLFFLGCGAGLYFPSAIATIISVVPQAYLVRGMAIHELAPNISFVAAPLICDFFLAYMGWRSGLNLFGLIILVVGFLYIYSSYGTRTKGTAPDLKASGILFRMPAFWGMLFLFSLAICSTHGVYSMAPLFLVNDHGMEPTEANNLLALSRVAAILMPIAGGWLGDSFGKQRIMGIILLVTGVLAGGMAMVPGGFWLTTFIVAQPIIAVCFFASGFAYLSSMEPPECGNIAVSLCLPPAFLIGGGVMPTFIGLIGQEYSIGLGFILVGVLMVVGGGMSFFGTFIKR